MTAELLRGMSGPGPGRPPLPPGEGLPRRVALYLPSDLLAEVERRRVGLERTPDTLRRLMAAGCARGIMALERAWVGERVRVGLRVSEQQWRDLDDARAILPGVARGQAGVLAVASGCETQRS